ncbi:DUF4062 domain-containing protein [Candidatus Manganitrophus noduliformans]|uniref:DUF4062 domain-containing protein n=1 Tax=Candidatus Manganitrophus noduliformans TaxID=2606439 RepID=A0A7X6DR40_9BACT|nr:DUF4062 domain-containing protein [Candidatus Manganitrophus noduliformans]NKE71553.1 DUF4062 domain-containing protein [Candidatus Manganitrophus noduliformans]
MSSPPNVMVSSTFYDLRQIRTDLAHFIADELGYIPLLSELPSFPIDPDLDTIENCRARVEKDANVFVLIVGGRYGSIDDKTDKSITNLEFLSARQKGIPIYAFVEKSVLAVVPTWKNNRTADFSATVDTRRVFEFIEYVRSQERVWTFPFETAQDIVGTLRRQLAYLFSDSLKTRLRLNGGGLPSYFDALSPKALRIALEKPKGWEYRLFLQSFLDEVERHSDSILEYKSGLTLDPAEYVIAMSAGDWILTRMHELQAFVASANKLLNTYAQESFGKPGEAGDLQRIIWVSRMLGSVLDGMLRWAKRIRCARLDTPFERVGAELSLFVDNLIGQFQTFPRESLSKVEASLSLAESGQTQQVELTMVFTLANLEAFQTALAAASARAGLK